MSWSERFVRYHKLQTDRIRPAAAWSGTTSSWRVAVALLAHHLICRYQVPVFLASAWYATDPAADKKRGWFVSHSRDASFRSLNLPIAMTRKMERIFLGSRDDLDIHRAMRLAGDAARRFPPAPRHPAPSFPSPATAQAPARLWYLLALLRSEVRSRPAAAAIRGVSSREHARI